MGGNQGENSGKDGGVTVADFFGRVSSDWIEGLVHTEPHSALCPTNHAAIPLLGSLLSGAYLGLSISMQGPYSRMWTQPGEVCARIIVSMTTTTKTVLGRAGAERICGFD